MINMIIQGFTGARQGHLFEINFWYAGRKLASVWAWSAILLWLSRLIIPL